MTDRELMQQALAALAGYRRELNEHQPCDAERALEARLAQPEPEPGAWESRKVAQLCTLVQRVQLEPVAWMVITQDGKTIHMSTEKKASDRWRKHDPTRQVIPLYAGAA